MSSIIWDIFHDGTIERMDGSVPGDITLFISIEYLREMLPGEGGGFVVVLSDCSHVSFEPYDQPVIAALEDVTALQPVILSATDGDPIQICCSVHCWSEGHLANGGTLFLRYRTASLYLDNGAPITLSELDAASEAYWTKFENRRRAGE